MSRLIILAVIVLALSFQTAVAQESSDYSIEKTSLFKLHIEGLDKAEGEVRIAMFDSEENYTKETVYAVVIPVDSLSIEWSVEGLPFGEYAIAVYHDKNENGKLDANFLGIPKEDYGFSNNARGRFGPASWKDARFSVDSESTIHQILIK